MNAPIITHDAAGIAALFETTADEVAAWIAAGCPHETRDGQPCLQLAAVDTWRAAQAHLGPVSLSAEGERRLELEYRSQVKAMEAFNAEMREKFVPASVAKADLAARVERLKGVIRKLPGKIAARIAEKLPGHTGKKLAAACEKLLAEPFGKVAAELPDDPEVK